MQNTNNTYTSTVTIFRVPFNHFKKATIHRLSISYSQYNQFKITTYILD